MQTETTAYEEVGTVSLTRVRSTVVRADRAKTGFDPDEFVRAIQSAVGKPGSLTNIADGKPAMAVMGGVEA